MTTTSGSSVEGLQTLQFGNTPTNGEFFIDLTSHPLPPAVRVGYLWVYSRNTTGTNQHRIVFRNTLYLPGTHFILPVQLFDFSQGYTVTVDWKFKSLPWSITVT